MTNNYVDKDLFRAIVRRCERDGADVLVGFNGGRSALRATSVGDLAARMYKWDRAERPIGPKTASNWIPGDEFLEILREIHAI